MSSLIVFPLGRMVKPTSWDRILQDEPLDIIPEKLVSDVNSTGPVTITFSGNVTNFSGPVVVQTATSTYLYSTEPSTSWPGDNSTGFSNPHEPPPFARNRKERHTLASLSPARIDAVTRLVDKAVGPRDGRNDSKWNAAFWYRLTPPERTSDERRRHARRPR